MSSQSKTRAIAEVAAVFILAVAAIWLLRISPLGEWERSVTHRPFLEYGVMMAVPLIVLKAAGRRFAAYGLHFGNLKYNMEIGLTCCVPYAAAHALMFGVRLGGFAGALFNSSLAVIILLGLGWFLRQKPSPGNASAAMIPLMFLPVAGFALPVNPGVMLTPLVFYTLFLGPGEEMLFRGFIESRLNESFGRRRLFFGVQWGWGTVICALLFGLFHLINLPSLMAGRWVPQWGLGVSAIFWGLFFSYIREKTGSIIAPAAVHGVPQAIAMAFMGR